jgi:hypothetical protein
MTYYKLEEGALIKLSATAWVNVKGYTCSVALAFRRNSLEDLAAEGLYCEFLEPNVGYGWIEPAIGTDPDGFPCAYVAARTRSKAQAAGEALQRIRRRASDMQDAAAYPYSAFEAAAWRALEDQARDWMYRVLNTGNQLRVGLWTLPDLDADSILDLFDTASDILDTRAEAIQDAKLKEQEPGPESQAVLLARQWLSIIGDLGPDLRADCGHGACVSTVLNRVQSIIEKADRFRERLGQIKRWRRHAEGEINAMLDTDADATALDAHVEALCTAVADGVVPPDI